MDSVNNFLIGLICQRVLGALHRFRPLPVIRHIPCHHQWAVERYDKTFVTTEIEHVTL